MITILALFTMAAATPPNAAVTPETTATTAGEVNQAVSRPGEAKVQMTISLKCECKKVCEDKFENLKRIIAITPYKDLDDAMQKDNNHLQSIINKIERNKTLQDVDPDSYEFFCSQQKALKGTCVEVDDKTAPLDTDCSSSLDCANHMYCVYAEDAEYGKCKDFKEDEVYSCGKDDDGMYPQDAFTCKQKKNGAVVLHCLGVLYVFITLAIVCDDYFVPALEVLIEKYSISDDVAGATFMAAGGSAPELFTSIVGVFLARSDVGFGTIIGSAVFNVLLVIGACSVAAGRPLALTWWPLTRDSIWYMIAIMVLYILVNNDNMDQIETSKSDTAKMKAGLLANPLTCIVWWEAIVMLCIYAGYVTFMALNTKIETFVKVRLLKSKILPTTDENALENGTANGEVEVVQSKTEIDAAADSDVKAIPAKDVDGAAASDEKHKEGVEKPDKQAEAGGEEEEEEEEEALPWHQVPEGMKDRINWVIFLPINFLFAMTIPDCRKEEKQKFFYISFVVSILWIAAWSYLMVWWATEICYTFEMPITVMGLTVLAAGTSVPDLITSVIVAKKGHGDMAVSSSIGSNIFDLCMGLPMPWFVDNVIVKPIKDSKFGKSYTLISSDNALFFLSMLVGLLAVTVISIMCFRWKISKPMGLFCLIMYFIFISLALAAEYEVIDVSLGNTEGKKC
jgi:K+-dependent Na+/Ca+ exchanger-like protein